MGGERIWRVEHLLVCANVPGGHDLKCSGCFFGESQSLVPHVPRPDSVPYRRESHCLLWLSCRAEGILGVGLRTQGPTVMYQVGPIFWFENLLPYSLQSTVPCDCFRISTNSGTHSSEIPRYWSQSFIWCFFLL